MNKYIKVLPEEFEGKGECKGYYFRRCRTYDEFYVYAVNLLDSPNNITHYEVIKKLITPLCIDFEKKIFSETHFKEYYPKGRNWGTDGWTCKDWMAVKRRINKLLDKEVKDGRG